MFRVIRVTELKPGEASTRWYNDQEAAAEAIALKRSGATRIVHPEMGLGDEGFAVVWRPNPDEAVISEAPALPQPPPEQESRDLTAPLTRADEVVLEAVMAGRETAPIAGHPPLADMKEGLRSGRKPDISHVRLAPMVYASRGHEYGECKYCRANYLRRVLTPRADFERLRAYLRAAMSHLALTLDSMERHQANDPELLDVAGMRAAAFAPDTDATPAFPASGLPHLAHAAASINMAITQAVDAGLLPADPGRPWEAK